MKYLLVIVLLLLTFVSSGEGKEIDVDMCMAEGYVAFVVNEGEKTTPDDGEDSDACRCNGTGWVTHGDGHRTPCPAEDCEAKSGSADSASCDCGCLDGEKCSCENCPTHKKTDDTMVKKEEKTVIYMLTASWCGPCESFKRGTLPSVKRQLKCGNLADGGSSEFDVIIVDIDKHRSFYNDCKKGINDHFAKKGINRSAGSVPTFIKAKGGFIKDVRVGGMSTQQFMQFYGKQ